MRPLRKQHLEETIEARPGDRTPLVDDSTEADVSLEVAKVRESTPEVQLEQHLIRLLQRRSRDRMPLLLCAEGTPSTRSLICKGRIQPPAAHRIALRAHTGRAELPRWGPT
jgi:hypothetical protein